MLDIRDLTVTVPLCSALVDSECVKTETQMTNHSFKGHWGPSPGFATESFYDLGHTQPLWGPQFPHM